MRKVNVIAMAGSGQRFVDQSFKTPKPLIIINGKPMFYYATKSLPLSKKNIFICKKEMVSNNKFKYYLKKFFRKSKVIYIKKKTNGQATTCKIASNYIKDDDIVTYGSCDFSFNFDTKKFNRLIKLNDLILFVYKSKIENILNFKEYGWVKKEKNNSIQNISCKDKVSNNPKNDYVITGNFTFRNKKIFHNCYNEMIKKKYKINNEYYMDTVAKCALNLNYNVKYIEVKNFKSFGTPRELLKDGKK